ncbi:hypothetical protein LSH36_367g07012 [Paralvinella palmiformis]|uniref:Fucosyltransferase N-terminal domain-containing protein n=1 Tax=Paralvinella palmiformis TaxID=53620 RepID=A0AAD9JDW0_9ANNE|nr:hypothetical protein LSH36_367g07012 [Paralvinella palmiformis]
MRITTEMTLGIYRELLRVCLRGRGVLLDCTIPTNVHRLKPMLQDVAKVRQRSYRRYLSDSASLRTPPTKELSHFWNSGEKCWTINNRSNQINGTKLILAWGSFEQANGFGYGRDPFKKKCGSDRCELIADMRRLSEVDSVAFYVYEIGSGKIIPRDIKVPLLERAPGYRVRRSNEQIFVFFHIEPPTKNQRMPLTHLNDYSNLTMSYTFNTDNDIIWRYSLTDAGKILDHDDQVKLAKAKTKPVASVVSNCQKPHRYRRYLR